MGKKERFYPAAQKGAGVQMALGASIYSRHTVLNEDLRPREKKKERKELAEQI